MFQIQEGHTQTGTNRQTDTRKDNLVRQLHSVEFEASYDEIWSHLNMSFS